MSGLPAEFEELGQACAQLGVPLDGDSRSRLIAYLDLLYTWNRSAGLTTIDRSQAVRLHLLDALSAVQPLAGICEVADLGTGGGLPGIPLALVRPDLRVVLVEKKRRKCSFLREAVRTLGLSNATVLEADTATLIAEGRSWEAVVARAFQQMPALLETASQLAERLIVAMLGPSSDPSGMQVPDSWEIAASTELVLPGGCEQRLVLSLAQPLVPA